MKKSATSAPTIPPLSLAARLYADRHFLRDGAISAIILFLVSSGSSIVLFGKARTASNEIINERLSMSADHIAALLDGNALSHLQQASQTASPEHKALLARLDTIRSIHPLITALYTVRMEPGQPPRIILEGQPEEGPPLAIGRPADEVPEQLRDILKKGAAARNTIAGRTWVTTRARYAMGPLAGHPGVNPYDFVVVGLSHSIAAKNMAALRSAFLLGLLLSTSLALAGGFVVYRLRKREFLARQLNPTDKALFRQLTSVLPGMLYQARISRKGEINVTYVSEACRWVFEMEPHQLMADPSAAFKLIHPEDHKRVMDGIRSHAAKGGATWKEDFRVLLPEAGERWRFGISHIENNPDGSSVWHGFFTDVTWRKETVEALRKSDATLRAAMRLGGLGTWEVDLVPGEPFNSDQNKVRWSEDIYSMFGLDPTTTQPSVEFFFSLVHPDDVERTRQIVAEAFPLQAAFNMNFRVALPGGLIRHFHLDAEILNDETTGQATSMLGTVRDTSEEYAHAETIRINEERLALATHAGRIGTWDYEIATRKIYWNDVMYEMKHVSPETYDPNIEQSVSLLHPDDRERVVSEFRRCLASNETDYFVECRIILPDGQMRHTKSQAIIIRDRHGQPRRVVGIEIDVTLEREAIEAARSANLAKSAFLAMISHEIRTPLNGILGFTSLLKSTALSGEQADYVETIERSGEHLLVLINDILDLSKIESGRMEILRCSFELRPLVQQICAMMNPHASEKHLELLLSIAPSIPAHICTDRTRLGQILTNLIGNAVKFTVHGRVQVEVNATPVDEKWMWRFSVKDTGPGIPEAALPRIFERFYQADLSDARRHGGTGLGLAISRRLAHLLGGDIEVTSELGRGSEFVLSFVATADNPGPRLAVSAPLPAGDVFRGKRLLVVEDNPASRRLCVLQLQKLGFKTDAVESGEGALEKCRGEAFDAILMDVQMPGMDGLETTRALRSHEKIHVPIIALTANAMPEDRQRCLDAGMDDYLAKPLKVDRLMEVLGRLL